MLVSFICVAYAHIDVLGFGPCRAIRLLQLRALPQVKIVAFDLFNVALSFPLLVETQTHSVLLTPLKLYPVLRIFNNQSRVLPVHFTQCRDRPSFTTPPGCELELELPSTAGMRTHVRRSGSLCFAFGKWSVAGPCGV